MKKLVIDRGTLVKNLTEGKNRSGGAATLATLGGDGFGLGLCETANVLADHGVRKFAVGEIKQAQRLRSEGFVEQEIFFSRSTTERETLGKLMDLNLIAMIGSSEAGMALNSLAEERSTVAEAVVRLDCGRGDGGFLAEDHDKILNAFRSLQNVAILGLWTEVPKGAEGKLEEVLNFLHGEGVETGLLFGRGDSEKFDVAVLGEELAKGVGVCRAEVQEIRWLGKGQTIFAQRRKKLHRAARLASIPVGYLDGLPRKTGFFGEKLYARIGGKRAKIVGIFEEECLADVTELKCKVGDEAELNMEPLMARMEREYRG